MGNIGSTRVAVCSFFVLSSAPSDSFLNGPNVRFAMECRFGQRDEAIREVVVNVLAFDMPLPDAVATKPKVRSL